MEERRGSVESSEPDDGITEDRMDLRARLPGGVSLGNHRRYIAQYSEGEGMTFKPGARYCGHGRRDEQGVQQSLHDLRYAVHPPRRRRQLRRRSERSRNEAQ